MKQHVRNKAYLAGGIILSILGILWLIHALGIVVPEIIVSFPSLIMLIGLITLIQTKFKSEVAWVIFGFGVVLMLNKLGLFFSSLQHRVQNPNFRSFWTRC